MLTWFSASGFNANTAIMDANFGITGYIEDGFETTALISGLTITLSGNVPTTTWTTLPTVFNPNTQGDGNETNNQWDGSDVVDNATNNQLSGGSWATLTKFNYAPGAFSFGIGLSSFQSPSSPGGLGVGNHELFVNGVDMGMIETLAPPNWSPGVVRNAYLRVDATGGSTITSVGFENILPPSQQEDFLIFDHLAVVPVPAPEPSTCLLFVSASPWLLCGYRDGVKVHTAATEQYGVWR
jgi:hypothetical protein